MERRIVMAESMMGESLSVKVRANGQDYEVYQKAPLDDGPWKLVIYRTNSGHLLTGSRSCTNGLPPGSSIRFIQVEIVTAVISNASAVC